MGKTLPGWAVSEEESVRSEAAPYIEMTPSDRLRVLAAVCRAAGKLFRSRTDAEVALSYVDPLPASSVAALERLRSEHRKP
jgi:hypothetical protein